MRGKNKGWTDEQDKAVLAGKKVEGKTSRETTGRRYKLKSYYAATVTKLAAILLKRLGILHSTGCLPDFVDKRFLNCLKRLSGEK